MNKSDITRISELSEEIKKLPRGYISQKNIGGRTYFYLQWSEGGKKKSRYLRDDEISAVAEEIETRRALQKELSDIKSGRSNSAKADYNYCLMHMDKRLQNLISMN